MIIRVSSVAQSFFWIHIRVIRDLKTGGDGEVSFYTLDQDSVYKTEQFITKRGGMGMAEKSELFVKYLTEEEHIVASAGKNSEKPSLLSVYSEVQED